jgi:hypothetical protein
LPTTDSELQKQKNRRKSPRLQEKGIKSKGKSVIKKSQEIVARKCGILEDDQEMDNLTLQQYIDLYKHPLTDQSIEVIVELTDVVEDNKKKKKKKKA